jgi:uncharacterized protein YjbJ (UPF0337 family)
MMDWGIAAANWRQFRGAVKARWGKLSDEQLEGIAGKRESLLLGIIEAYGIHRSDAQRELKAFEERNRNYWPK